jgi:hypothetical protein
MVDSFPFSDVHFSIDSLPLHIYADRQLSCQVLLAFIRPIAASSSSSSEASSLSSPEASGFDPAHEWIDLIVNMMLENGLLLPWIISLNRKVLIKIF